MSGDLRAILEANLAKGPLGSFEVPEWGKTIFVFPQTLSQRIAIRGEDTEEQQLARLVQVRARDEGGHCLFNESDYDAMLKLSNDRLIGAIADKIVSFDPDKVELTPAEVKNS